MPRCGVSTILNPSRYHGNGPSQSSKHFIMGVAGSAITVLLLFVIPTFEKMFKDFGGAMPGPTQFLIDLSHAMTNWWYVIFGVPVVLSTGMSTLEEVDRAVEALTSLIEPFMTGAVE